MSHYKCPWARVYTYRSHRVKRNGQPARQEVMCYPLDTSLHSNQSDQFTTAVIPADLIHIRIGVSPPPGVVITVHAFPPQFPLAITYVQTLVTEKYGFEYRRQDVVDTSKKASVSDVASPPAMSTSMWRGLNEVVITPMTLSGVAEFIAGYLWRSDVPGLVKEYMFHLLAQVLRILYHSQTCSSSVPPTPTSQLSPLLVSVQTQLRAELRQLYEEETKTWASARTITGTGIGLGIGDTGRFSTYFHALMEVCLAMAEVITPTTQGNRIDSNPALKEQCTCSASDTAIPSSAASKRKKVKVKTVPMLEGRQSSSLSVHDADSCTNMSSSSSATSFSSATSVTVTKPEDMLWFHRALTMLKILRRLTTGDSRGEDVTSNAVVDAAQSLSAPTSHTRVLVISGLPQSSDALAIRKVIQNACNANGGLYKDELYMPTIDTSPNVSSSKGADHPTTSSCSSKQDCSNKNRTKGYAVVELRSKSKIDSATKTLLDCQSRLNNLSAETLDDSIDGPSLLSVMPLNAMLFTESDGAAATEGYLLDKLVSNTDTYGLNTAAIDVFTDIFHSCYICAHNLTATTCQQESGYICLSKDQIMMQVRISLSTMHLSKFMTIDGIVCIKYIVHGSKNEKNIKV